MIDVNRLVSALDAELKAKELSRYKLAQIVGKHNSEISAFLNQKDNKRRVSLRLYALLSNAVAAQDWKGGANKNGFLIATKEWQVCVNPKTNCAAIFSKTDEKIGDLVYSPSLPVSAFILEVENYIESLKTI